MSHNAPTSRPAPAQARPSSRSHRQQARPVLARAVAPALSFLVLASMSSILLLASGCKKSETAEKPTATKAADDPTEVSVSPEILQGLSIGKPALRRITGELRVTARVQTDARRVARVGSPVSGRILKLLVFEGQNVHAGTVLATLHSTDLADAQLALIKAHSSQVLDEAASRRAEQLVAADVIGKAELERRRAELLQANAEAASYRTQLRGLGMGEGQIRQIESTNRLSAEYPIVAPKSGTVLERKITVGQVVQPADEAFTIADLSRVWVGANVPEEEAGSLHRGLPVTVSVPALPDAKLQGSLSYVAPVVDPATRTVEVRMEVPNAGGQFKPDELASMTFTGKAEQKLTVPSAAVFRESNKDYVFVQTSAKTFRMREVTLGTEEDDRRVVLGGLTEDDPIVLDGAFHLNNQRKQNAIKGAE